MVVDGTQPASVNYSIANIDIEKYVIASKDIEELTFIDYIGSKNLGDAATDCVIRILAKIHLLDANLILKKTMKKHNTTNLTLLR